MEQNERYVYKLAKYILLAAGIAIVGTLCWYFRSVLVYILIAVVVSLIAKPVMGLLQKMQIKGRKAPDWFLAVISLTIVLGAAMAVIVGIIPIVGSILKDISLVNIENAARSISVPLADLNTFLRQSFPNLGEGFRLEVAVLQEVQKLVNVSMFSTMLGSAASFVTSLGVGLFSVVFIGFFFIKDDGLFTNIICALVPDKHEKTTEKAIADIGHLLSRYFIGVMIEIMGVALINFLGLWLIARLGFNAAIGIAFLTGILNIIPYVGPLLGGALGTLLGLIIKYSSIVPIGLDVNFWLFTGILIAIFCFTQLIDNFLYQPVIYSTSIKSKPLEIFIVLLIVGHIGGPVGMIVAIPCYTVVRVIAFRFFRHIKAIRRLIPSEKLITDDKDDTDE
ncbi:MAG: AI-2E family transporter [Bacteroidales bacterium]|nr:AI-2E family transporter [Bacteroidales bacterium]